MTVKGPSAVLSTKCTNREQVDATIVWPMYSQLAILRSKTDEDAVARLQSGALLRGFNSISGLSASLVSPQSTEQVEAIGDHACVLIHYDDDAAIHAVRKLRTHKPSLTVGCFGSDIYKFDDYLKMHDVVDFYLTPTALHRRILIAQLHKPVYLLPESIDPATMLIGRLAEDSPDKESSRLVWFGYPESFEKGMASLAGVVQAQVASGTIDSLSLIIGTTDFKNRFNLPVIPYSKDTFARDAASFDYCVLSHFPLDLALNSYTKSPNKLITALMLGLIPLASRTPAYEDIMVEFGLESYLFESPSELNRLIQRLDPAKDSQAVRNSGIVPELRRRFADASIAFAFKNILNQHEQRDPRYDLNTIPDTPHPVEKKAELRFSQHMQDLVPSFLRAVRFRTRLR